MEIDPGQLFAIIGEYEVRCRVAQAQLAGLEARIGKLEAELQPRPNLPPEFRTEPPWDGKPGAVYDVANHSLVPGTVTPEAPLRVMPGWAPQRERA